MKSGTGKGASSSSVACTMHLNTPDSSTTLGGEVSYTTASTSSNTMRWKTYLEEHSSLLPCTMRATVANSS